MVMCIFIGEIIWFICKIMRQWAEYVAVKFVWKRPSEWSVTGREGRPGGAGQSKNSIRHQFFGDPV